MKRNDCRESARKWIDDAVAIKDVLKAMAKSTDHLEAMVKRAISAGIGADYILG
jgi:hypothetical protein